MTTTIKTLLSGTLTGLLSLLPTFVNGQCSSLFFNDNFSFYQPAWTVSDPIDGNGKYLRFSPPGYGFMKFDNNDPTPCNTNHGVSCGRENRTYKSLGGTLSNTTWRVHMDIMIQDGNGPSHVLLGFTAGNA